MTPRERAEKCRNECGHYADGSTCVDCIAEAIAEATPITDIRVSPERMAA